MKRFYSHYTFIYPSTFLKNHIVETDASGYITGYYPFTREISGTEFHSGLQVFIPENTAGFTFELLNEMESVPSGIITDETDILIRSFRI